LWLLARSVARYRGWSIPAIATQGSLRSTLGFMLPLLRRLIKFTEWNGYENTSKNQPRIGRPPQEKRHCVSFSTSGSGQSEVHTGLPFLDHMLDLFARHGLFDLEVACQRPTLRCDQPFGGRHCDHSRASIDSGAG